MVFLRSCSKLVLGTQASPGFLTAGAGDPGLLVRLQISGRVPDLLNQNLTLRSGAGVGSEVLRDPHSLASVSWVHAGHHTTSLGVQEGAML